MKSTHEQIVLTATVQERSTMTIKSEFYYVQKFIVSMLNKGDSSISFHGKTEFFLVGKNQELYEMYECSAKLLSTIDPYMESVGEVFFLSKNEEIYNANFISLKTDDQ